MKVGILGSGVVAQTLASGFLKHGHEVTIGTRSPDKLAAWAGSNPQARVASFAEAAVSAELGVLSVKGSAAIDVLRATGGHLDGKPVIDATNPIADAPPVSGVLRFFTTLDESLLERIQREFPGVRLVKAFNSVGAACMVNPHFAAGRPTMFVCGNDASAKSVVGRILDEFGWDMADMGSPEAARAIEPLAMLWCIPGFTRNQWTHAFRLLTD